MRISPTSRIGIGFGMALILLIAVVCASMWTTFCLRRTGLSADHALSAVNIANDLHRQINIMQGSIRTSLVSGEAKHWAEFRAHTNAITRDFALLRNLNNDDALARIKLDSIESMTSRLAAVHDPLVPIRSRRELTPSELLGWYDEFSDLESQIHRAVDDEIESRDRLQLAGDAQRAKTFATGALYTNGLGGILAIFFVAVAAVITVRDARARGRAEDQLRYQASHDALTGLPNRFSLNQELEQQIGRSQASGRSFALLLIDLDRFKAINDSFGHHYGDMVLRQMRLRLGASLRTSDMVARLGGDEFAILLPGADWDTAIPVAERIEYEIRKPIEIDGLRLEVGASIGIALYPEHGQGARELFLRADEDMYAAKRRRDEKPAFIADSFSRGQSSCQRISTLANGTRLAANAAMPQPVAWVERCSAS